MIFLSWINVFECVKRCLIKNILVIFKKYFTVINGERKLNLNSGFEEDIIE